MNLQDCDRVLSEWGYPAADQGRPATGRFPHLAATAEALGRERVRRAGLVLELLGRQRLAEAQMQQVPA